MSKRKPELYLQDIFDSISKIEKYVKGLSYAKFGNNSIIIDAVVRNLEIIGEAAKNVPKEIQEKCPNIPWRKMSNMRNKVLHEYFGVDTEILWQTIKEDLPELKEKVSALLK